MKLNDYKLNPNHYVFEYRNIDIINVLLNIEYDIYKSEIWNKGEKSYKDVPMYSFEITGVDKNNNKYNLSYELLISRDEILSVKNGELVDCSKNLEHGEIFLYINDKMEAMPYLDKEGLYNKCGSCKISRTEDNYILFKLFLPNDDIFIWFELEESIL